MAEHSPRSGADIRALRVLLVGSGGGHLRQLLDLVDSMSDLDVLIVTEDTAFGRSIGQLHRTHFVEHVALGLARRKSPFHLIGATAKNFVQSTRIAFRERPDVIITTGAGSVYFSTLWGRLLGARIILIDSLARFESLSTFARLAGPLAHHRVVQSPALSRFWPDAKVFDPIRLLDRERPSKQPLLIATVGATLPFDRLVNSVSELKARGEIAEDVLIQTGVGGARPAGMNVVETLPFDELKAKLHEADIVVCHGGTGSLIMALREGCRVVAMPRLSSQGEHYDRHQSEITRALAARGMICVANSTEELSAALKEVRLRKPVMATSDPSELAAFIRVILDRECKKRQKGVQARSG
jgi:UDP-N-acetylglucosamine--N-acetylmuramyl-(pentapeptide) pyrophosphoryl-undecaprenol N-acetylglucosamine transferase